MLKPQKRQRARGGISLMAASIIALLLSVGRPSLAASADVEPSTSQPASTDQAAIPAKAATAGSYAQREAGAQDLEQFSGGGAGIYIGGSSVAVVLLIVLLILII